MAANAESLLQEEDTSGMQKPPKKANLIEYVLHQHSCLGVCFAKIGSPPIAVGNCCCISADDLEIRQRIWLFIFVLVSTMFLSVRLTLGIDSGAYTFAITTFILMPLVCFLKSTIARVSIAFQSTFRRCLPYHLLRFEEILLFAFTGVTAWNTLDATASTHDLVIEACIEWAKSFGTLMAAEVVTLIYMYFFCSLCCRCCVPTKDMVHTMGEHEAAHDHTHQYESAVCGPPDIPQEL